MGDLWAVLCKPNASELHRGDGGRPVPHPGIHYLREIVCWSMDGDVGGEPELVRMGSAHLDLVTFVRIRQRTHVPRNSVRHPDGDPRAARG